ncbi:hypothetical protein DM860_009840 [Cuscuta australis]|uniref:IQ domain-containing protein IQM2-like n=1 Tax=Cuscuta australis TaxID=267555 RepID=A0A328DEV3_9ASTE|nr:hypothetical protein DM860_009840 [Cuscuta australis]
MGLSFSCPLAAFSDPENGLESVIVKSIDFGKDEEITEFRSVSFNAHNPEPSIPKPVRSGSIGYGNVAKGTGVKESFTCTDNPEHEVAAIKLQKVYKSFRTRRKLADCAVLIEHSWWKLLDFAELKHSSISFFHMEKHESASSRWSRARTRAAKVGKGLSKNGKAQKLALQHWLEAIDPRHRYGHNLHIYYVQWLHSQSNEPFFYWLDIGEGKDVNLVDKCPRGKLQQQCIKYLGPMERKTYEVEVKEGKLMYKNTRELVDTDDLKGVKWIFVLSTSKTLYIGKKTKGAFQHSSFLAGGATLAAGRIVVENGILKAVWPHSGHYRPTPENFQDFISFLKENDIDLTNVKLECTEEEEQESSGEKSGVYSSNNSSEEDDLPENEPIKNEIPATLEGPKLTELEISDKSDFLERLNSKSPPNGYESTGEEEEEKRTTVPEESILRRINSHKGAKSYQLGNQLSCKWSSGVGPRIGCVRDYPSQLQSHALGEVALSPKSANRLRAGALNRVASCSLSPMGNRKNLSHKLSCLSRRHSSPLSKDTLIMTS